VPMFNNLVQSGRILFGPETSIRQGNFRSPDSLGKAHSKFSRKLNSGVNTGPTSLASFNEFLLTQPRLQKICRERKLSIQFAPCKLGLAPSKTSTKEP
jgi:hypothetical protein